MSLVTLSEEQLNKLQNLELDALLELDRICKKHNITYSLGCGTMIGAVRHKGFIPWDDDIDVFMMRNEYKRFKKICKNELDKRFFYQSNDTDSEYYHLFDKIRVNGTLFKEALISEHCIHHGVYIDIFPFDYVPENVIKRKIQFLRLQFLRTGLMVKYLDIKHRYGVKKVLAKILRVLYKPFKLSYLYAKFNTIAQKYDNEKHLEIYTFCSSFTSKHLCKACDMEETIRVDFEGYKLPIPKGYDNVLHIQYGDYMKLPPKDKRIPKHDLERISL